MAATPLANGRAMKPLISVVMPLFNAADTVLFALGSLQAQTCQDWECIVVDDGSTDESGPLVQTIKDGRIQYHRLDQNYGRGYARQHGLMSARGKYIAFLDADDWIYPSKFADQAALFDVEPNLALVSTGMAIVDARNQLAGIRSNGFDSAIIRGTNRHLSMPPVAFAPSMIVTKLAASVGFDRSFPISEDIDFLLRALEGREYAVLPSPLYVYREHASVTPAKVSLALEYCCLTFKKQSQLHPIESAIEIAKARTKQCIYRAAAVFGLWEYMIRRRSRIPSELEHQRYRDACQIVSAFALDRGAAI